MWALMLLQAGIPGEEDSWRKPLKGGRGEEPVLPAPSLGCPLLITSSSSGPVVRVCTRVRSGARGLLRLVKLEASWVLMRWTALEAGCEGDVLGQAVYGQYGED